MNKRNNRSIKTLITTGDAKDFFKRGLKFARALNFLRLRYSQFQRIELIDSIFNR